MIVDEQGLGPVVVLQQTERSFQHGVLALRFTGSVERMPVSKRDVKSARRSCLLGEPSME